MKIRGRRKAEKGEALKANSLEISSRTVQKSVEVELLISAYLKHNTLHTMYENQYLVCACVYMCPKGFVMPSYNSVFCSCSSFVYFVCVCGVCVCVCVCVCVFEGIGTTL